MRSESRYSHWSPAFESRQLSSSPRNEGSRNGFRCARGLLQALGANEHKLKASFRVERNGASCVALARGANCRIAREGAKQLQRASSHWPILSLSRSLDLCSGTFTTTTSVPSPTRSWSWPTGSTPSGSSSWGAATKICQREAQVKWFHPKHSVFRMVCVCVCVCFLFLEKVILPIPILDSLDRNKVGIRFPLRFIPCTCPGSLAYFNSGVTFPTNPSPAAGRFLNNCNGLL